MATIRRTYGRPRQRTPLTSDDETPPTSQYSVAIVTTPKSKIAALLAQIDDAEGVSEWCPTSGHNPFTLEDDEDNDMDDNGDEQGTSRDLNSQQPTVKKLPSVSQIMQGDLDEEATDDGEDSYQRLRAQLLKTREKVSCTRMDESVQVQSERSPPMLSKRDRLFALANSRVQVHAQNVEDEVEEILRHTSQTSGSDSEDIEAEIKLSSARRAPRRMASKKAIEEMHRETERLSRNMTLAPEAAVHKKLKIADFFSKVGYEIHKAAPEVPQIASAALTEDSNRAAEVAEIRYSDAFAKALEESEEEVEPRAFKASSPNSQHVTFGLTHIDVRSQPQPEILLDSDSDDAVEVPAYQKTHKLLFRQRDEAKIERDRKAARFVQLARPESPTKIEARAEKHRKLALLASVAKQAKDERLERETALKAAGHLVVSAADRQKEAIAIEDLVEKARLQAEELRRLEKKEDERKKAREDGLNDESEHDSEWDGQDVYNDADDSGFGDTDDDTDDGTDRESTKEDETLDLDEATQEVKRSVVQRNSSILSERLLSSDDEESEIMLRRRQVDNRRRARRLLRDQESENEEDKENTEPSTVKPTADAGLSQFFDPTQVDDSNRSPVAAFSLSQLLGSPSPSHSPGKLIARDVETSLDFESNRQEHGVDAVIPSSQPEFTEEVENGTTTQFSIFSPLSPDIPVLSLQPSAFTQATEVDHLSMTASSTTPKPLGRLRQGEKLNEAPEGTTVNPFRRMREQMDEESHRKSRKALLDDRAIESDDEYAGLGGASDEDPEDAAAVAAELADMIDNDVEPENEEDQRRIAAYYAQQDLEKDEKMVNALMNDINNGGLRRKRGAGLLDMDDSEDEEEETARYKARQALMRARLLESQNLTSLADNPKTKAFIEAMEDKPALDTYIEISGECDIVRETQEDMVHERDEQDPTTTVEPMPPPTMSTKSKRRPIDIRSELSFLQDDEAESQTSMKDFDPAFVPTLKRERSSLSIDDRTACSLSRENSQSSTYQDPRISIRQESMYAKLGALRREESRDSASSVVVVTTSSSLSIASKMASRAVNYRKNIKSSSSSSSNSKDQTKSSKSMHKPNRSKVLALFK